MTNRLDSLNSKKSTAGQKAPLKFKPKVVVRKSKEERDSSAPIQVKKEEPSNRHSFRQKGPHKGRIASRDPYNGSTIISSGPLAAGTVSGNSNIKTLEKSSSKISVTPKSTSELHSSENSLDALQSHANSNHTPLLSERVENQPDSEEDDDTKINMNRAYEVEGIEFELFPVRPHRDEEKSISVPEITRSDEPDPSRKDDSSKLESPSKGELLEERLEHIKELKASLESKISEPVDILNQKEHDKVLGDQEYLLDVLTEKLDVLSPESNDESNDSFIMLYLPAILPQYEQEDSINPGLVKTENANEGLSLPSKLTSELHSSCGEIGHMNIHQSGKITINLGNDIELNPLSGIPSNFLQEVVVLDMENEESSQNNYQVCDDTGSLICGNLHRLGTIDEKIICTPSIFDRN
ncbi:uncharacterized protein PRCAT00003648001 [Priceomyces carsonii]|uniref:uncharacterized protein n=1 Tax=Priceomyces carsonii TaxID=28549 RepID=UPI002EDAF8E6|nr:unnamed protein product [Priceomyces carsonii]